MTDPVVLWLRGRSPAWPGLVEGLGAGVIVDAETDPTSMREVRARAVDIGPDAIVYAGWRDLEAAPGDEHFKQVAEATISVAAASMELGAAAILVSHPAVFSGPGGPWSESDPPAPGDLFGEAFRKAEIFLERAAARQALVVRAGPVLGGGLAEERAALEGGRIHPSSGRRVTPIADRELGRVLRALHLMGARGVVHVGGPAVEEAELWFRIARATGAPSPSPRPGAGRTSWALARHRLADLGVAPVSDWAELLEASAGPPAAPLDPAPSAAPGPGSLGPGAPSSPEAAGEGAALGAIQRFWSGALPAGATGLDGGAVIWRLTPGERAEPDGPGLLLVREGKVVLEEADEDRVLRAGQGVRLARAAGVRVAAVEPSEVWRVPSGGA